MSSLGADPKTRYATFVMVSVSFLVLVVLLCVTVVNNMWGKMSADFAPTAILYAVPSLLAAAVSHWVLGEGWVAGPDGRVSIDKVQAGGLVVYAVTELGVLLSIFVSQSQWAVVIAVAVFPVGWLTGFMKASALWKAA